MDPLDADLFVVQPHADPLNTWEQSKKKKPRKTLISGFNQEREATEKAAELQQAARDLKKQEILVKFNVLVKVMWDIHLG